MIKILNKILIFLVIVIIFSGMFLYFSNTSKSEAATSKTTDSALSSTTTISGNTGVDSKRIAIDTAFISKLTSLTSIKIENSLFSNKSFLILKDNNIDIKLESVGRVNPFATIGSDVVKTTTSSEQVVTNEPTQITASSVVLNGTVSETSSNNVYFEYGNTETLGKTTNMLKQSLIGGFTSNISGLTSKTKYFYRAVSKINNSLVYGEIISFSTK